MEFLFDLLMLILGCIGVFILTAIVYAIANNTALAIGIGGGLLFLCIVVFLIKRKASALPLSIIGTILAAIVRVAIGGAGGICFYVTASITNAATCYCIGYGDVIRRRANFKKKRFYSAESYARSKYSMERDIKNWEIINCLIFGILALIGCFKPFAAFLPLAFIILRTLWVRFRNG